MRVARFPGDVLLPLGAVRIAMPVTTYRSCACD